MSQTMAIPLTALLLLLSFTRLASATPPNIVLILADDLGWADVGWRNPYLHTPTLDRLAREGMILNQSYVQQTCSPSRAALMTGKYPYHFGLQDDTISATLPLHLPDDQPILPQVLRSLGYATHMVGKWHLGFCNWRYTPTYLGFDSFYGFYNAAQDYFNHTKSGAYDFRDGMNVDRSAIGHYSTDLFTDRAVRIIKRHEGAQPLFLYLAYQAVHAPLQALQRHVDAYCSHIADSDRRTKCGMLAALDEGVNRVITALQQRGLSNNTFLLFSTDNGGPTKEASSNWPLRGSKITLWEGGTRATAFVHAPSILHSSGNVSYNELIHIVDWFPTFVEAAGGASSVDNIDGVSQWSNLVTAGPGPRTEFLYNMNEVLNNSALRQGRFKLVQGFPRNPDGWYAPPEFGENATTEDPSAGRAHSPAYQLFNLQRDPEERKNILDTHQDVFQQMKARLDWYRQTLVPTASPAAVPESDPDNYGGNWSPGWC